MEPVTHFLTGAVLGRAGFNRRTAYATLAMTLAAEAPDLDVFLGFRGPVAGLEHHRGITHTLIGAPFVALAVTGTVYLWHRFRTRKLTTRSAADGGPIKPSVGLSGEGPPFKRAVGSSGPKPNWFLIWLFSLVAALSHLLLDFTNNYGLRPFFPFNPRWYSWSIVFIFEPLIFAALLAALVITRHIRADRQRDRRTPSSPFADEAGPSPPCSSSSSSTESATPSTNAL